MDNANTQAQTVATFFLAFEQNLAIVPVLNKIDSPMADPPRVMQELHETFALAPSDCLLASAKLGTGLPAVLTALVERIPPPQGNPDAPLRMLLFDAFHDAYRGVICLFRVLDGRVAAGDRVESVGTGLVYEVLECGVLAPQMVPTGEVRTGQVGYIITGMKEARDARVGDTFHHRKRPVPAWPGFTPALPKVFAGVYPPSADDFEELQLALDKLLLTDASIRVTREHSAALGMGFRCGFLGLLHMDVFRQRLEQEFRIAAIVTSPTVPYQVALAGVGGSGEEPEIIRVENALHFPSGKIKQVWEPMVLGTIIAPHEYLGAILTLIHGRRGEMRDQTGLGAHRVLLKFVLPACELAGTFYDELKSGTSGYASFDYEESDIRVADMVRLDVLVNDAPVDALARIVHRDEAPRTARKLAERMGTLLPRQQYNINVQVKLGGKIIARETVQAFRKDVTAKCYGGDVTRKKKLLEKQKEGKKKMKAFGNVQGEKR